MKVKTRLQAGMNKKDLKDCQAIKNGWNDFSDLEKNVYLVHYNNKGCPAVTGAL
jgi:aromatic ring-opening dioxygenase catalytic subunit (LigB family)